MLFLLKTELKHGDIVMNNQSIIFLAIITVMIHFNSSTLLAMEKQKASKSATKIVPEATTGDSSTLKLDKMKPGKNWFLRFTLGAGYGQVNNSVNAVQSLETGNKYHRNLTGTLSTEYQWGKYLGMEAEGYYGVGSSPSITDVIATSGTLSTKDRKIATYGILADVQMRYPLTRFKRDWGFHAGVGYGMMGVKRTNPVREAVTVDSSTFKVPGFFGTLGVEFRLIPEIAMGADFALAFATSPSLKNTTGSTDTASATFNSGSFSRIRVNANYIWDAQFRFGMEYARRAISASPNSANVIQRDVMNQFYATITTIL